MCVCVYDFENFYKYLLIRKKRVVTLKICNENHFILKAVEAV